MRVGLTKRWVAPSCVSGGGDAVHPLPATLVEPDRLGDGRRTVLEAAVSPVCMVGRLVADTGRDHDPSLTSPASEARTAAEDSGDDQRWLCRLGPDAQDRNLGGCVADRLPQFDEEQHWHP